MGRRAPLTLLRPACVPTRVAQALTEASDLEALRAEKRAIIAEERRLKVRRGRGVGTLPLRDRASARGGLMPCARAQSQTLLDIEKTKAHRKAQLLVRPRPHPRARTNTHTHCAPR